MGVPTGTMTTYDAVGNREDLIEKIFNISPTDTPFWSLCAKTTAKGTKHEWQTETLKAAAKNAVKEGADAEFVARAPTVRLDNVCQISVGTAIVSGTQDAVDKAGRKKELAHQMAKVIKELRRDIEVSLTGNYAKVAGGADTARELRPLCAWYTTNAQRGTGGANGSATTAATDATAPNQRALTETMLENALQACWTSGGNPDTVIVGPHNKKVISGFAGNAQRTQETGKAAFLATNIDIYRSDFGEVKIVPNRFSRDRDMHVLTSYLWGYAVLRPIQEKKLASAGDNEKRMYLTEYTLEARNEAGNAVVADLLTA